MILSMWQLDPEFRIIQELKELFLETGLGDRGIPCEKIVHPGHPLYSIASVPSGEGAKDTDSFFPKVGVEWSDDEPSDDLGGNYRIFPFDSQIKNKIIAYKARKDSEYEHFGFKQFDKILNSTNFGIVESYTSHIISNVTISGWGGSGNNGRKIAQELYKATMSVLPFLKHNIQKKYKASVGLEGKPAVNVEAPQVGRGAWGFEVMLSVRQLKREFRFTAGSLISKADVYFDGVGTLPGKDKLGKSQGNMNFHPLKSKI